MISFFQPNEEDIIDIDEQVIKFQDAIRRFEVSPILERFGTWAVTKYGVECLAKNYPIELDRVFEADWPDHMFQKSWVNYSDFITALEYARHLLRRREFMITSGKRLKVFLCHGKEDKAEVRLLYNKLLVEGIDPWLDEESLLPGQDWHFEISKAVKDCDLVLVCLSTSTVDKTGFLNKEISYALDAADYRPQGQIFIIPVRLDECIIPARLSKWHWADLFKEDGYERLIKALHHTLDTK